MQNYKNCANHIALVRYYYLSEFYIFAPMKLFQCLSEHLERVRRWSRTRGFGIQSPTDYRFVREVIAGHGDKMPQPKRHYHESLAERGHYLLKRLHLYAESHPELYGNGSAAVVTLSLASCTGNAMETVMLRANGLQILVVENINLNSETRQQWQTITADRRVRTSYDLYYMGIALFEPKLNKMHYEVNL